MDFDISVEARGPLFANMIPRAVDAFLDDLEIELGRLAVQHMLGFLDIVLQNPTGFYQAQITADQFEDGVRVHDRGTVYGPWLEGVSARNRSTRFKGYHHFEDAAKHVNRITTTIVERNLPKLERRIN